MRLSVEELNSAGAFTGGPVHRAVTWTNRQGEEVEFDVYVRRLSYHTAISDIEALRTDGDIASRRIAKCICDENGNPVFRVSDITGVLDDGQPVMTVDPVTGEEVERGPMDSSLTTTLLAVISEVNELGKTLPQS